MIDDWSVRAQIADDPETSQIAGEFDTALMPSKSGQPVPPARGTRGTRGEGSLHSSAFQQTAMVLPTCLFLVFLTV